jgi:hypothetical protein
MTFRLILFELRFWSRQPQLWIFLGLAFAFCFAIAVFEGGGEGSPGMVHANSPLHVYQLYANLAFLWLPMVTAFVNATAIRDFACNTSEIIFSTVVTRRQYIIGRFVGSTLVALIPVLGISLGLVVGSWVPYGDPIRFGPNSWAVHGQAILWFGLTSILFQSALMFAIASHVRSTAAAFVTSVALIVLSGIASAYSTEVDNALLSSLLDPFGNRALDQVTRYWSVLDQNTRLLPVIGPLTWNRLLWLVIGAAVFAFGYVRFSFTERRSTAPALPDVQPFAFAGSTAIPKSRPTSGWSTHLRQFVGLVRSDLVGLLRTPISWIIIGLCMTMLLFALSEVTYMFGTYAWPVAYNVIDLIRSVSLVIMLVIITFYSGELVWRDQETNVDGITSALPVHLRTLVLAKYTVLLLIGLGLLVLMGLAGIGRQFISGYTHVQPGLYVTYLLVPGMFAFAFWSAIALAIQLVVNNKYIGFGLFVVLFAVNSMVWGFLKVNSNLVVLFGSPRMMYSDLNGFGPFLVPWLFFRTYWLAFAACLLFIAALSAVRGGEDTWTWRLRIAGVRWRRAWRIGALAFGAWCVLLAFGFYNTRVLNELVTEQDSEALQVAYEQTYKRYRNTPLPHFTAVDITVELEPEERAIRYTAYLTLTNKGSAPVDTLWFSLPDHMRMTFSVPNALEVLNDSARFQRMFRLNKAMLLGDSVQVVVNGEWVPKGFANDVEFLSLVENGTFLNTLDLLPMIGYQPEVELEDPGTRRKLGLPVKRRMAQLSDDPADRGTNETMEHADHIRFACTIGTATDQIGIAPGTLKKEWEANGKRWFRYESETPIFNFWSVLSARYAVSREQAGDVTLEVYHHPGHGTNVPRMLKSMHDAIAYASGNFGPYQHKVARIIEFPRYRRFAQSFPATMPYSEAIGFITDLRDTSRIDMVYYVVAHEVAHQWWGHQVLGPRMQGSSMMVESMAQYTALMVLEKEYGRAAMRKFLKYERDNYLRGRGQEGSGEMPLMKVENQQYIHYNKGSVVMYGLRDFIGEERVNSAYRAFVDSFAFKGAPYPTTLDLYHSLEAVTTDSLHYLLEDGLKHITFYRNAITSAKAKTNADGTWTVDVGMHCAKLRTDSLGKEMEVPMNDWLDVAVEHLAGEVKRRVRLRSGSNEVRITVPHEPKAVVVDPDHLFFDREAEDDRKKVD